MTIQIAQQLASVGPVWPEQAIMMNSLNQLRHADNFSPAHYIIGWSRRSDDAELLWNALYRTGETLYIYPTQRLMGITLWALGSPLAHDELVTRLQSVNQQFDVIVTDHIPDLRRPGMLVMDMDSTTIQVECIDEIAKLAGVGEQVSDVTARAMRGELDFSQSLRARVGLLKGAPERILQTVVESLPLMPGLKVLLSHLQLNGWKVVLASGGFTYFANALQRQLGFDAVYANQMGIKEGILTGEVIGDIVDSSYKVNVLKMLREQWQIDPMQTMAVGDGANDLAMLAESSLGIALHAKPIVRERAKIAISHSHLEGIFFILAAALAIRSH
ncbi:phosphoserine phosphatase SerB [Celerinatantimonas sp. YJH-8]|uniref:phosphoserine phosphatase SerB n=1 Tax=Celerinatantimonas sp. YJH-8 TaxID=3228714 RepID=UPI0038C416D6